jgi:hypothetical protein
VPGTTTRRRRPFTVIKPLARAATRCAGQMLVAEIDVAGAAGAAVVAAAAAGAASTTEVGARVVVDAATVVLTGASVAGEGRAVCVVDGAEGVATTIPNCCAADATACVAPAASEKVPKSPKSRSIDVPAAGDAAVAVSDVVLADAAFVTLALALFLSVVLTAFLTALFGLGEAMDVLVSAFGSTVVSLTAGTMVAVVGAPVVGVVGAAALPGAFGLARRAGAWIVVGGTAVGGTLVRGVVVDVGGDSRSDGLVDVSGAAISSSG